ncbi:2,6-dihydropseudooxynicotine hydrolase [Favolaschia claudopus]|uniref:2,6-dihydropseudooxynicotine hydrolase n=1 Tax=Favolaschia claudopus TaxID=2862362 RepID=A0AAW0DJM0_9AGAR
MRFSSTLFAALVGIASAQQTNQSGFDTWDTLRLSPDSAFHFQLLILLGMSTYRGADVADVLGAANAIVPGSFTSFNATFAELATLKQAQALATRNKVSARDTFFQAASYWRYADFFNHGNQSDPILNEYWDKQLECFAAANNALPVPGEYVTIPTPYNFSSIGIFYAADNDKSTPKPTLLVGNGFDASQENSYHASCAGAVERGWNCMTYEGPGQPTVRRQQKIGFIAEWERVVTPVVDYLANRTDVDMNRLALSGLSLGGYLAERAAAFEPRIKALLVNPGVKSGQDGFVGNLPPELKELFESGNKTAFDTTILAALGNSSTPSLVRWGVDYGLWAMNTNSTFEFLTMAGAMNMTGLYDRLTMPIWVANGLRDDLLAQSLDFVEEVKNFTNVTVATFPGPEGYHCEPGADTATNREMFEWLESVFE